MFTFAISVGIYSYVIFLLGIFSLLYRPIVIIITIIYLFLIVFIISKGFDKKKIDLSFSVKNILAREKLLLLLLLLLFSQIIVNLIGTLGPELAFDAIWYHLTFPKLYLLNHAIYHMPGSVLIY